MGGRNSLVSPVQHDPQKEEPGRESSCPHTRGSVKRKGNRGEVEDASKTGLCGGWGMGRVILLSKTKRSLSSILVESRGAETKITKHNAKDDYD